MNVADHVWQRLAREGVRHVFLTYGGAISELCDALARQDAIKYVCCQHEQANSFAAEGVSKCGGLGVALGTSGPGGQNMVTGISNCYYDSTACIFITGQVATQWINRAPKRRQLGFQESPICEIVKPITKYAAQPQNAFEAQEMLETAIYECRNERRGPVLLDIPSDVQRMEIQPRLLVQPTRSPISSRDRFREYTADLLRAHRPAILVGGGALKASLQIQAFANKHSIPCFRTWNALDVITDDFPCYAGTIGTYGGPGRNFGIQNCDLLLSLGCRMSGRITGGMPETFARGAKKYFVDIDPVAFDPKLQQVKSDNGYLGDCSDFMMGAMPVAAHFEEWLTCCRVWRTQYDPVKPAMLAGDFVHHYGFMRRLSELLPHNAIIVSDTGGNQIMMGHCFRSKAGQRIFSSNGNTPMGFALCGAIGAWFAQPGRPIVCIIGDGGMQLNIQELQTIKHYGIPLNVFIINNHVLGNTKSYQRVNNMKEVACGPDGYSCPDFTKITIAYGLRSYHIPQTKYIDTIVEAMLTSDEAAICDVPDHDRCDYEPRVSRWDTEVCDMYPFLPRDEFRENMSIEPLPGWEKNT